MCVSSQKSDLKMTLSSSILSAEVRSIFRRAGGVRDQSQEGMKTAGSHVKMCPIRGSPRLRCPLWADAMQMMVFPQLT